MTVITRVPTVTLRDEWGTKVPSGAPHLNINAGVDTPNDADYVEGSAGQTNEYGGFDFSAIPAGSTINSITIRQRSLNTATQAPRVVRFALGIGGSERASVSYDVTTTEIETHRAAFAASGTTCDELRAGLLEVSKLTVGGTGGDPPIEKE